MIHHVIVNVTTLPSCYITYSCRNKSGICKVRTRTTVAETRDPGDGSLPLFKNYACSKVEYVYLSSDGKSFRRCQPALNDWPSLKA